MNYELLENLPQELKDNLTYPFITEKGYARVFDKKTQRKRFLHNVVYEYYNGKIPKGYQVHHKDFNRLNKDISNLVMVTYKEHRDIHAKRYWKCIDGVWFKPCKNCGELKPLTEFYLIDHKKRYYHNCKKCSSKLTTEYIYSHTTREQRNEKARINLRKRKERKLENGL